MSIIKKSSSTTFLFVGLGMLFVLNMLQNIGVGWMPSIIPVILRVIISVFCIGYCFAKATIRINLLTVSILLYAILSIMALFFWWKGESNIVNALINQNFSILMFGAFFIALKRADYKNNDLGKNILFAMFCVFSIIFFINMINGRRSQNAFVNNVYYIIVFVPISFIWSRKRLAFAIIVSIVAVIVSGKRTAFIALICAIVIPLFLTVFKKSTRKKAFALFAFLVGMILLVSALDWVNEAFDITLFERFETIEEDGGSGRIDIYKSVWSEFESSTRVQKLFGHGYNAVAKDRITVAYSNGESIATSAHNDFLEILYDYGLIALVFYLLFIISLIVACEKLYKTDNKYADMFLSALIIFLIMSSTSHLILYPTYIVLLFFAFACGCVSLNKKSCEAL